jgi:COMPASS component SWD3
MEEKENPIMCMDYNTDGSLFVTAGNDRQVRLYDDNMKSIVNIMKPGGLYNPGHSNRVFSLCFHKGFTGLLASGGWDNTVQFYDVRSGTITNSIYGPHICGDSIDFKDYQLLTGSWSTNNQIQIWDIRTYKLIKTIDWDKEKKAESTYCYAAQFSKDKNSSAFAVGCSNQNIIRMFDSENNDLPIVNSNLNKACYALDYSYNGKYFAFGSGDGNVRILNLEKDKEKSEK